MQMNIAKAFFMIVNVYLSAASMFPIVFNFCLCLIFSHQFKLVKRQIKHEACRGLQLSFLDKNRFEDLRLQHQNICRMVKRADLFICITNLACVVGQTGICIFILYSLFWYQSSFSGNVMLITMTVFWLIWDLLGIALTAGGSILVNNSVSDKNRVFPKVVLPIKLSCPKCKKQIVVRRFKFVRLQLIVSR